MKILKKNFNIKQRLTISNILMLAIPVLVVILVGAITAISSAIILKHNGGFAFDGENFYQSKEAIIKFIDESLDSEDAEKTLKKVSSFSNKKNLRIVIFKNNSLFFDYGEKNTVDDDFKNISSEASELFLANNTRQFYKKAIEKNNEQFSIEIYCSNSKISYKSLKIAIAFVGILTLGLTILSIFATNHFLSKFVFKKINEPIEKLVLASKEISSGNLDYQIAYAEKNEFSSVISEFNAMTKAMKESIEKVQSEEENKQIMIVGLTHDIKSPLTCIMGYIDGLNDNIANTKEKQEKYLNVIKRKCEEINSLVNKMLFYSKIESEKNLEVQKIETDKIIEEFVQEKSTEYFNKGLKITYENFANLKINISKENFLRILDNIASNSLKYKKDDIGVLLITTKTEQNNFVITFEDNGVGVPAESLNHIFEPFFRAEQSRSNQISGNGIGLAVVKKLINNAGGFVSAKNNNNGGLTVKAVFKI